MSDNITMPREVAQFMLQHLEWWSDDEPQEKEAITALRTALAAEQPSEDIEALRRENERLREALESIAANACCDRCQEAALVAKAALRREEAKP